jgi:hypothetical protein
MTLVVLEQRKPLIKASRTLKKARPLSPVTPLLGSYYAVGIH